MVLRLVEEVEGGGHDGMFCISIGDKSDGCIDGDCEVVGNGIAT